MKDIITISGTANTGMTSFVLNSLEDEHATFLTMYSEERWQRVLDQRRKLKIRLSLTPDYLWEQHVEVVNIEPVDVHEPPRPQPAPAKHRKQMEAF